MKLKYVWRDGEVFVYSGKIILRRVKIDEMIWLIHLQLIEMAKKK